MNVLSDIFLHGPDHLQSSLSEVSSLGSRICKLQFLMEKNPNVLEPGAGSSSMCPAKILQCPGKKHMKYIVKKHSYDYKQKRRTTGKK